MAMMQVRVKHPQKVTLHLGGDYYAEVLTTDAIRVLEHRLTSISLLTQHFKRLLRKQQKSPRHKRWVRRG